MKIRDFIKLLLDCNMDHEVYVRLPDGRGIAEPKVEPANPFSSQRLIVIEPKD